ncbi:RNA polymerase sigma-70 factor (ECF subfamily) [Chitinophaga dinghuensis]|uniref:RNA polymerase sigma-70 factor (ECF subfamily) n=2 Tax=Chitinophaga dinghuensis TaxID=1539050 RepID=A0A327VWR8_9BACT|nr:RNA polymerase sigma-70 factor (ECF subfamily) [Chitinophaga dinghuensis]
MSIVIDATVSGDVLQEVFMKIWKQIDHYDVSRGRLFTWMHNIARSTAIDMVRSKAWQHSRTNKSLTDNDIQLPDKAQQQQEDLGLRKMVKVLKPEYRAVVELSYFEGYKQEEIAKIVGIPLGTVKTRLRAALLQLRKEINF